MNVYFARSLRGDRSTGDEQVYKDIIGVIKRCGHRPQFEIQVVEPRRLDESHEQYIYRRDMAWIDACDAMIAEVTTASHGVGYEIAYAEFVRKMPIFFCARKDTLVSAMLSGKHEICYYRDLGDLSAFIEAFLGEVEVKA